MEIAIPHTGKVVLRYLNETLQNQVFQIYFFFFCLFVISLCWTLHISRTTMRGSCWVLFCCMGLVFFFPFHHSPLSRLHRNRGTIITSDFDKCLGPDLNSSFNFSSLLTQILSYQDNFKTTSSLVQSHLPKSGQTKKLFFLFFFEEMPHCGEQDGPITLMPWKILNPLASACLASQIGISCKEWWNPLVAQISCLVWRTSEDRFLCLKQSSYGQSFQCHEIDTRPAGCSGVDTQ